MCRPKEERGLGIRRLSYIHRRFHGKLLWLVLKGDTLWGRFARAKYTRGSEFVKKSAKSPLWNSIASHEQCFRSIGL